MISPHTPPGTCLVTVWLEGLPYLLAVVRPDRRAAFMAMGRLFKRNSWGLKLGQRCTLTAIVPNPWLNTGFAAEIAEFKGGSFPLECFDVAALPKAITDMLTGVPTKVPEDA